MVSGFISRIVILIFGTLYPAYASYKAVRTKNVKEYVKWMMYWIVFALFTCVETFTDLFLSFWFPFYYELKIITVIYLLSPATNGSSILYRKFVHPVLTKKEQEIDEYIAKAKEQGYHTMLNLGSKGVTYATSLIMQTAIKGGGNLFNQLKKSYSLNDLHEDQRNINSKQDFNDQVDNRYIEDPRVVHRLLQGYSTRHTISGGASYPDSYFPEVDSYHDPLDLDKQNYFGEIPYSGISSGYSSTDSLSINNAFKEPSLLRTASLGGTNRIRTRAASRSVIPKRASLAEGGFTWPMEELRESQLDSEEPNRISWARSLSLPFSVSSISHLIKPEYHHLFGQITQEQMLAFVNNTQYNSVLTENVCLEIKNDENKKVEVTSFNTAGIISDSKNKDDKNCLSPFSQIVDVKRNDAVLSAETSLEKPHAVNELEIENSNEGVFSIESNTMPERCGKYNKKPAPVPPNGGGQLKNISSSPVEQEKKEVKDEEDEEEEFLFITPNTSPVLDKKLNFDAGPVEKVFSAHDEAKNEPKNSKMDSSEISKNTKAKGKNISKKLHLPKMSFSFWGQKNAKTLLGPENSSIASSDNAMPEDENHGSNRNELEFFIPLKSEETGEAREKEQ